MQLQFCSYFLYIVKSYIESSNISQELIKIDPYVKQAVLRSGNNKSAASLERLKSLQIVKNLLFTSE